MRERERLYVVADLKLICALLQLMLSALYKYQLYQIRWVGVIVESSSSQLWVDRSGLPLLAAVTPGRHPATATACFTNQNLNVTIEASENEPVVFVKEDKQADGMYSRW